jgi:hypothetical protein
VRGEDCSIRTTPGKLFIEAYFNEMGNWAQINFGTLAETRGTQCGSELLYAEGVNITQTGIYCIFDLTIVDLAWILDHYCGTVVKTQI